MVQGQQEDVQERLGEAALLAGVAKFPQRIKCATLSWKALEKAIERSELAHERKWNRMIGSGKELDKLKKSSSSHPRTVD